MISIPTSNNPPKLGQRVLVAQLPSPRNFPGEGQHIFHHFELAKIVGGMSIIEDGARLTLYQVRTLRERSKGLPAWAAGWYPPQEIAMEGAA